MTDFVQIPPDSSGKKMKTIYNVEHDVHVQATHNVSVDDPSRGQRVDQSGAAYTTFTEGSPTFDSYNRLQVTDSRPVFTTDFSDGVIEPYHFSMSTGNVAVEESGALTLSTGTSNGELAYLQTDKHFRYTPGYSTSFLFTMAVGDSGKTNLVRRVGAFNPEEGLYYQIDSTGLSVNIHNGYTNEVTSIPQAEFNGDKLDGTGITGRVLDLTKDNLYWIEYQWLGAGAVAFGTYIDGDKVLMHQIDHFGVLNMSYTRSGNYPFRIEQFNDDIVSSSSEFRLFCISISESGAGAESSSKNTHSDFQQFTVPADDEYHFITVRPTQTNSAGRDNRTYIRLSSLQIHASSMVRILAFRDVDITSATWTPFSNSTKAEKSIDAVYTNGIKIGERLVGPNELNELVIPSDLLEIVRKADITESQSVTLVIIPVGNDPVDITTCLSIIEG